MTYIGTNEMMPPETLRLLIYLSSFCHMLLQQKLFVNEFYQAGAKFFLKKTTQTTIEKNSNDRSTHQIHAIMKNFLNANIFH